MTFLIIFFVVLLVVALLASLFLQANPAALAGGMRIAGPLAIAIMGGMVFIFGRPAIGGGLLALAFGWYMAARRRSVRRSPGRRSHVRTAALEMMLDHATGGLEGLVLAGSFEGRELGQLQLDDLLALRRELVTDHESLRLLDTYLDGRFPVWREHVDTHGGHGKRGAPGSGAMTKQEAYDILGLEAGASASEVRKAHRRLMQRLHPDVGGTSFLAARINEAKDVLLSDHD